MGLLGIKQVPKTDWKMLIRSRTAVCCLSASVLQPSVIQEVLQGMKTRSLPVCLFIACLFHMELFPSLQSPLGTGGSVHKTKV